MPFSWNSIHQSLVRSSSTLPFNRAFATMHEQYPALARFTDASALLEHLHRGSAPSDDRNNLLRALVAIAQCESRTSDVAVTVLLLAMWPGLDAVFHRLSRRVEVPDELPSQILDRAVEQFRRLDLQSVRRVAATVLMNIERDVARLDLRERHRRHLAVELDPELVGDEGPEASVTPDLLLRDAVRHAGEDGRLVVSIVIEGLSHSEMAVSLGVSEAATRKRYQRAVDRLRIVFSGMSQSVPQTGFSPSSAHARDEKEGTGDMNCIDEDEDLLRMPGLFRRWEFSDVLETRRTYRLEEAGAHADGTPLVAIYTNTNPAKDVSDDSSVRAHGTKSGAS